MRIRSIAATAGALLIIGSFATPAVAATETGNQSCNVQARVGVHGQQQRLDMMTLKVRTTTVYESSRSYTGSGTSNYYGDNVPWSGTSTSLLFSGTYGYCSPV